MTDVIPATLASYKLLADNTLRATFDIDPKEAKTFLALFSERGDLGAIARLNNAAPKYSSEAQILYQSTFFRCPPVWKAIGTDEDYQAWTRNQKCVICNDADYVEETGEMKCEYAHVRRAGAAGTGFKPPYSGVPMCHLHHQMQHQYGEAELLARTGKIAGNMQPQDAEQVAKEWFDRKAIENIHKWGWETLKEQLGYQSWKDIPPQILKDWAINKGPKVAELLPKPYYIA